MSRRAEIDVLATLVGLSAGHYAAWGPKNREAFGYERRLLDRNRKIRLNEDELVRFRKLAVTRALQYLEKKVQLGAVRLEELATLQDGVQAEVDRLMSELRW